jgi:hypothetical protein
MYLDPPPPGSEDSTGDSKGEQLFYKVANLDDRIKNADQVGQIRWPVPSKSIPPHPARPSVRPARAVRRKSAGRARRDARATDSSRADTLVLVPHRGYPAIQHQARGDLLEHRQTRPGRHVSESALCQIFVLTSWLVCTTTSSRGMSGPRVWLYSLYWCRPVPGFVSGMTLSALPQSC